MQFAWARPDQDLKNYFDRAHRAGCKVTHMAGTVAVSAGSFITGVLFLMAGMALTAVAFSAITFGNEITATRRALAIAT